MTALRPAIDLVLALGEATLLLLWCAGALHVLRALRSMSREVADVRERRRWARMEGWVS